jgi:O-antigen/teichoic acid export membrane protein
MARTRKALVTSLLVYIQFAAGIAVTLVSVPLTIDRLGARVYGIWLASGEALAYVAFLDFGILGVLPWMVAEADGRGERNEIRRLIVHGLAAGAIAGVAAIVIGAAGWMLFGVRLSAADRAALAGPFTLLVALTAVTSPLWVFAAVLAGLQDATFNGIVGAARVILGGALTLGLLLAGAGLYALAIGAAVPALVVLLASALRLRRTAPDLLRHWPSPSAAGLRYLVREGLGGWIGAFGWRLVNAGHNVVIAYLGLPELVPVYACTSRLSQLLTQLGWVVPDSGAVGLAQLQGEGRHDRVRTIVDSMLRLYVLVGAVVAAAVLAFNPAFVTSWVGAELFGGVWLNVLLAAGALGAAMAHGLSVVVSVLGDRLKIGIAVLAQGAVQVAIALLLGLALGLNGIAIASLLSAAVTVIPVGIFLLYGATGVSARAWLGSLAPSLATRTLPVLAASCAVGIVAVRQIWLAAVLTAAIGLLFLWLHRPLYESLPVDNRVRRVLVRLRLLPVGA